MKWLVEDFVCMYEIVSHHHRHSYRMYHIIIITYGKERR